MLEQDYLHTILCMWDCSTNNWLGNVEDFDGSVFNSQQVTARKELILKQFAFVVLKTTIWFRFVDTDPNSGSSSFGVTGILKQKMVNLIFLEQ